MNSRICAVAEDDGVGPMCDGSMCLNMNKSDIFYLISLPLTWIMAVGIVPILVHWA